MACALHWQDGTPPIPACRGDGTFHFRRSHRTPMRSAGMRRALPRNAPAPGETGQNPANSADQPCKARRDRITPTTSRVAAQPRRAHVAERPCRHGLPCPRPGVDLNIASGAGSFSNSPETQLALPICASRPVSARRAAVTAVSSVMPRPSAASGFPPWARIWRNLRRERRSGQRVQISRCGGR